MSLFKNFEREVVRLLVGEDLSELDALLDSAELESYEHTGGGYYLTMRHPSIPPERVVHSRPLVLGKVDDVECGFVVFRENGTLTLECHSWGAGDLPEDFRELSVQISQAD